MMAIENRSRIARAEERSISLLAAGKVGVRMERRRRCMMAIESRSRKMLRGGR